MLQLPFTVPIRRRPAAPLPNLTFVPFYPPLRHPGFPLSYGSNPNQSPKCQKSGHFSGGTGRPRHLYNTLAHTRKAGCQRSCFTDSRGWGGVWQRRQLVWGNIVCGCNQKSFQEKKTGFHTQWLWVWRKGAHIKRRAVQSYAGLKTAVGWERVQTVSRCDRTDQGAVSRLFFFLSFFLSWREKHQNYPGQCRTK